MRQIETLSFARVPREANINDFPSRLVAHPFLLDTHCCNSPAEGKLGKILAEVALAS